jgi:hypothetical protein
VRAFVKAKVAPVITKYWVDDAFPFELLPVLKELGIGGLEMQGYGCAGGRHTLDINEDAPKTGMLWRVATARMPTK